MNKVDNPKAPRQPGSETGGVTEIPQLDPASHCINLDWQTLDRKQAALALGIGLRLLDQMVSCAAIPSLKLGERRLFRADHIRAWLDAGAPQAPGSAARVIGDFQRRGGGR